MIDLIPGDCLDVMPTLAAQSYDAIIADIPYGTTACKWDTVIPFAPMWENLKRLAKPKAAIVLFGSQPFTSALVMSNPQWFRYEWIWHKSKSGSAFTAAYRPMAKHENVLVFGNGSVNYFPQMIEGKPYHRRPCARKTNNHKLGIMVRPEVNNTGTRYPDTVQYFVQDWRRQEQVHPTQKPVALMEYLIRTYTNEGDAILDFTMGSGTTMVACVNTKRNGTGIEKDAEYYAIAQRRIQEAQAQMSMPIFTNVGKIR